MGTTQGRTWCRSYCAQWIVTTYMKRQDFLVLIMTGTSRLMYSGQIRWFTCDRAVVNGITICELEKEFYSEDPVWKAKDHDIL
jgi:hypothetical protein